MDGTDHNTDEVEINEKLQEAFHQDDLLIRFDRFMVVQEWDPGRKFSRDEMNSR